MNIELLNQKITKIKENMKRERKELKNLIEQRNKLDPSTTKYKCPKCEKILTNKTRLDYHLKHKCARDTWNCSYCHVICSSKKYLERHEIICAKRICPHCKTYRSNRKNVLARHIQQCKLASEQKPDVVSEIKEILPVHHDEPSQLQPVHLSDDDVSQTHLDQSVHNT